MNDVRIVFARKDIACTTHISRELINFVEFPVDNFPTDALFAQIPNYEIVGGRFAEFRIFQINASDPNSFALEPFHHVAADKSSGATNKCLFHRIRPFRICLCTYAKVSVVVLGNFGNHETTLTPPNPSSSHLIPSYPTKAAIAHCSAAPIILDYRATRFGVGAVSLR